MHRFSSLLLMLVALYVSTGCSATHAPAAPAPAQAQVPSPPAAVTEPISAPPAIAVAPAAPAAVPDKPAPHIALLLPLKSSGLGHAAEAVEQGFMAAASVQPHALPVRVYGCADERKEIAALYQQALANGAQVVVGPLTRDGVIALTSQPALPVPTLVLNNLEVKSAEKLYFFGLPLVDSEARQIARLAIGSDLHFANIVSTDTPQSKRLVQVFSDEWKKQGGEIASVKIFNNDPSIFNDLAVDPGNMVFIAASAEQARLFRPYLNAALPVYSTSQIFNGNADPLVNYDLRDVRFVDMPWLLQTDYPAVMLYPRANPPLDTDMERLYALGIDAFRLGMIMANNGYRASLPLAGVTGTIRLEANHQFQRTATGAFFKQGRGLTPEAAAALAKAAAASSVPSTGTLTKP